jgi:ATPase family protein associated with various cellular activities (AAA)
MQIGTPWLRGFAGGTAKGIRPDRRPLLIGIDGPDGVGKSSLASWLCWQLEMPSIHLDLYLVPDSKPQQWRTNDLERVIQTRIDKSKPVIVEGVLLLDALDKIGRPPDLLVPSGCKWRRRRQRRRSRARA